MFDIPSTSDLDVTRYLVDEVELAQWFSQVRAIFLSRLARRHLSTLATTL